MANQEEKPDVSQKSLKKKEFIEAKPMEATITFDIPAYSNKDGSPFKRVMIVPTRKAYAIFKRLAERKFIE